MISIKFDKSTRKWFHYIEKNMLLDWLRKETSEYKLRAYTLGQLRAMRKILEGNGNEEK